MDQMAYAANFQALGHLPQNEMGQASPTHHKSKHVLITSG